MKPLPNPRKGRPIRLDRPIESLGQNEATFDLEVVHRAFKESLLVARLLRRPTRHVRGRP